MSLVYSVVSCVINSLVFFCRMYFDAHAHLTDELLFPDWKSYVDDFISCGGLWLVTVGTSYRSNEQVIRLCHDAKQENFPCLVKSTLWYHPYEVVSWSLCSSDFDLAIAQLEKLYRDNEHCVVAFGEAGIDLHYDNAHLCLVDQQKLLVLHCRLAVELNLPLVIHSRDAFHETLDVLKDFPDLVVYFHCWSYTTSSLHELLTTIDSVYVWFCGNLTYKSAQTLRESLSLLPLHKLLLETDSPYLSPQERRWKTNLPSNIRFLYDFVSQELWIPLSLLQKIVEENFRSLYDLA